MRLTASRCQIGTGICWIGIYRFIDDGALVMKGSDKSAYGRDERVVGVVSRSSNEMKYY